MTSTSWYARWTAPGCGMCISIVRGVRMVRGWFIVIVSVVLVTTNVFVNKTCILRSRNCGTIIDVGALQGCIGGLDIWSLATSEQSRKGSANCVIPLRERPNRSGTFDRFRRVGGCKGGEREDNGDNSG